MNTRQLSNYVLVVLLFVYSLFCAFFLRSNCLKYLETISAVVIIVIAFVSILLLGFWKDKGNQLKRYITFITLAVLLFYFIGSYFLGFVVGFVKNSYSLGGTSIINNIFAPVIFIIFLEIFRYTVISSNKSDKLLISILTFVIILFEMVTFAKGFDLSDYVGLFKVVTTSYLPILCKNVLFSYLDYHVGYKPVLLYRLIMDIYMFVFPIFPDLGEYITSMAGVVLPFLIYVYSSRTLNEYFKGVDHEFEKKSFKTYDIPILVILLLFMCLVSGYFPLYLLGIGSQSMSGTIEKGDAIIAVKLRQKSDINKGDIIVFNLGGKKIIHRVVKIDKVDGITKFKTKGDANNSEDNFDLEFEDIKGKVLFKIPVIAWPSVMVEEFIEKNR